MLNFTIKLVCFFFLFTIPFVGMTQERSVSGKVTDAETGDAIPGVNVVVKGSTTGTSTDSNGQYQLTVSSDKDVLVYSFIGYLSYEIMVANQTTINIKLESDVKSLEEVV